MAVFVVCWIVVIIEPLGVFFSGKRVCFFCTFMCGGLFIPRRTFSRHCSIDMVRARYENNKMQDIIANADLTDPIYDGAHESLQEYLTKYFTFFISNNGLMKTAFSSLLKMQKDNMPAPNCAPESYQEGRRLIRSTTIPLTRYDACKNDCIIYRNCSQHADYTNSLFCPVCGETRQSSKRFIYMAILTRLKRWFGECNLAKLINSEELVICHTSWRTSKMAAFTEISWNPTTFP